MILICTILKKNPTTNTSQNWSNFNKDDVLQVFFLGLFFLWLLCYNMTSLDWSVLQTACWGIVESEVLAAQKTWLICRAEKQNFESKKWTLEDNCQHSPFFWVCCEKPDCLDNCVKFSAFTVETFQTLKLFMIK